MKSLKLTGGGGANRNQHFACSAVKIVGGLNKPKKLFAFTLAEVLITLAIIGVVAALTIPTLMVSYQKKQYYTAFMKEYNALSNALSMAQAKHGELDGWTKDEGMIDADLLNKYLKDSLKIEKVCHQASDCASDNYTFNFLSSDDAIPFSAFFDNSTGGLLLSDGAIILIDINQSIYQNSNDYLEFDIDTNGKKGPNILGRDIFVLNIYKTKNGYVLAPGYSHNCSGDYCEPISEEDREQGMNSYLGCVVGVGAGQACALKLLLEGKMNY